MPSDITPVTLRDYIDIRLSSIEISLKEISITLNSLRDQSTRFLTRPEYEAKHEALDSKIHLLELNKATLEGKANQGSVIFTAIIAVGGIVLSIIALFKEFIK